ncbi:MAG: hypothetical protein CH104c_0484 [Candidatus Woesebacteria bacterium]|nr:MAG: hypothetical protein CH104c_0484 [Candidatus Woesebacteria bacterium]
MINIKPIKPLLKEDYISPHLQDEQKKREIEPITKEGLGWRERLWLWLVRVITKFLRKYG